VCYSDSPEEKISNNGRLQPAFRLLLGLTLLEKIAFCVGPLVVCVVCYRIRKVPTSYLVPCLLCEELSLPQGCKLPWLFKGVSKSFPKKNRGGVGCDPKRKEGNAVFRASSNEDGQSYYLLSERLQHMQSMYHRLVAPKRQTFYVLRKNAQTGTSARVEKSQLRQHTLPKLSVAVTRTND
jgi:hypothetical protein